MRWQGANSTEDAAAALARRGEQFVGPDRAVGWVMTLGDADDLHRRLDILLAAAQIRHETHALDALEAWTVDRARDLRGILCAYRDVRRMTDAARTLARHAALAAVPFEHVTGLHEERVLFERRDEYPQASFIGPGLLDRPGPHALYEESLALFEQKCGLRDYLDLYQWLRHIVENGIPGDVAEFGSYRGHSGWLIARTLQALGSDKRLYMFDTFTAFPREAGGIDHFWNDTHSTGLTAVRARLAAFPNVTLVPGDFTQTLADSGLGPVALAWVDCDSYRATRFLFDALWDRHVVPHGALICEDYGHPALLGSRAAVHDALDGRHGVLRYFSQFSGVYVALKL